MDGIGQINNASLGSLNRSSIVNPNLVLAQLQQEIATGNKDAAMEKINGIRAVQEESARITDAIATIRNLKTDVFEGLDSDDTNKAHTFGPSSKNYNELRAATEMLEKYGITNIGISIDSSGMIQVEKGHSMNDYDAAIKGLEGKQEEMNSGIQQEMVFVQDLMGQYNSNTQGSSASISKGHETDTAVNTGR